MLPRYHPAMLDADKDALAFDPPDADAVYARYLETCKHLGADPVPRGNRQRSTAVRKLS
jgi:hypothetical protein